MSALLFASHDAEQLRAAIGADTLHGGPAVLHRYFLRLGDFLLCFTFHTIGFCHGICLPSSLSLAQETLSRILPAAPKERQGTKRQPTIVSSYCSHSVDVAGGDRPRSSCPCAAAPTPNPEHRVWSKPRMLPMRCPQQLSSGDTHVFCPSGRARIAEPVPARYHPRRPINGRRNRPASGLRSATRATGSARSSSEQ